MRWIAVDWGTSALRATLMDGGAARETRSSDEGMSGLTRDMFEPTLRALVGDWIDAGATDIRAAGMVGSRQGWREAPYALVPRAPSAGAVAVPDTDLRVRIAPGLSQRRPHPDVMRGEETQIAGILARDPGFDGCACLPGTHTKWVHVSASEVVSFLTVMSGELFALIAGKSILRHSLQGGGWDADAFAAACADALSRPETLTARLFRLRAADLLEGQDAATARATLSGLLLGCELAAARPWWLGRDVVICGSDKTAPVYRTALESQGIRTTIVPAAEATLAGLAAMGDPA